MDIAGFDAAMAEQKAKARAAWAGSGEAADAAIWFDLAEQHGPTDFLGYDTETAEGIVLAIVSEGRELASLDADAGPAWVVFNQTPFYAEAGGQVADHGHVRIQEGSHDKWETRFLGHVSDVQRRGGGLFAHHLSADAGRLDVGDAVKLEVDHERRTAIRANHSATHLLHEALRNTLGDHVAQRGSLNDSDRLRFDFSHAKPLSPEETARVETEVNAHIRQNAPVETRVMTPDAARDLGALALFGEKYGDEVRVVSMGVEEGSGKGLDGHTYSVELCGGTHVRRTGDIGVFVLTADSASSAGVRRVEALTGETAFEHLSRQEGRVVKAAAELRTRPETLVDRIRALVDERKALANEVAQLRRDLAMAGGAGRRDDAADPVEIDGVSFLAQVVDGVSGKDLPALIDEHKARLGSGAVLLIAESGGKVAVAAGVTDDLTVRLSAVDLVRAAVSELGGKGGGGRPDLAQGGGRDAANADAAIDAAQKIIGG